MCNELLFSNVTLSNEFGVVVKIGNSASPIALFPKIIQRYKLLESAHDFIQL